MLFQGKKVPQHVARKTVSSSAAMAMLQSHYAGCVQTGIGHRGTPWTHQEACTLGRLYVAAWGTVPTTNRMRAEWCLPSAKTILMLYGSYQAYFEAIVA